MILGELLSGRIVFISATGHYTGVHLNTHGAVAKAGVDALSAQLAIEMGPHGITSNVIAPGPIQGTEGVKRLIQQKAGSEKDPKIPVGRLGRLKEVADAAVYLFADTGDYVNGHVLVGECCGACIWSVIVADKSTMQLTAAGGGLEAVR